MSREDETSAATTTEFEVRTERASGGAVVVRVVGELDLSTQEQLRNPLVDAAEAGNTVVVDLTECEFIDSSGIRALLLGHEAVASNEGDGNRLMLAGVQPQVQRVLEMTGVGEAVPMHESVDAALGSL
jgi:anti-sigma B factor antagonist